MMAGYIPHTTGRPLGPQRGTEAWLGLGVPTGGLFGRLLPSPRFCYYISLETFNTWHLEIRRDGSAQGSNPRASTYFTCLIREIIDLSIPEIPQL